MFLANEAMLMQTADWTGSLYARKIFTARGTLIPRPAVTLASKIVVSVLIFLQLVGLAAIAWYIYRLPTWAPALDALAAARMGKSLRDEDLPPIGPVTRKDVMKLTKADGLVGVVVQEEKKDGEGDGDLERGVSDSGIAVATEDASKRSEESFRLGLGAEGLISRKLAPKKDKK
jgi:hypothetical protein